MKAPANRLQHESSPYLRQHAHNPVDWYPWGAEAFERARRDNKPIFLSVGYAACHWCHVMEHESFEDPETAQLMNEAFVNVKVDREERPDVDEVYMHAVQLFTGGHGGWPMSVFLTPDLEPYFGGTYFPPDDRHGMPAFRTVLRFAADAYHTRGDQVTSTTQQVRAALDTLHQPPAPAAVPEPGVLHAAFASLARSFDAVSGGFGGAPKFPRSPELSFLLHYAWRFGHQEALRMAVQTLTAMARGGIHDHLGGGLHRYAVDGRWRVPHFEKMLYDNALLAQNYLDAHLATDQALHADVARGILDWVLAEMRDDAGGFYSALDADSDGGEGRYYVWTPEAMRAVLGPDDAEVLCAWFDVTPRGNFEAGTSVLSTPQEADAVAARLGIDMATLHDTVQRGRAALRQARAQRMRPHTDDKIVLAWNALMIRALARGAWVLEAPHYLQAAIDAATFLHATAGERPFRTWRAGVVRGPGFLDDAAGLVAADLDLWEATLDPVWLERARAGSAQLMHDFATPDGGLAYTGAQHEKLLVAPRGDLDGPTPSGVALQLHNLLRLAHLTGEAELESAAEAILQRAGDSLEQHPSAHGALLDALLSWHGPRVEVVLAGPDPERSRLLAATHRVWFPDRVVAGHRPQDPVAPLALLEGRAAARTAQAWVCEGRACQAPVSTPEALRAALAAAAPAKGAAEPGKGAGGPDPA